MCTRHSRSRSRPPNLCIFGICREHLSRYIPRYSISYVYRDIWDSSRIFDAAVSIFDNRSYMLYLQCSFLGDRRVYHCISSEIQTLYKADQDSILFIPHPRRVFSLGGLQHTINTV